MSSESEANTGRKNPPAQMKALKELLPLAMPLSVMLEPTNLCNFRCKFCPTGNHALLKEIGRPNGTMKYELYTKIVDDIKELCVLNNSKLKRIHLYKDGEPLLHKDIGRMVAYAKKQQISESVDITTNAALLTAEKAAELIEAGLDGIRVSVEHVTDKGYKEVTQTFSDYETIKKNVEYLFEEKKARKSALKMNVKIVDSGLTEEEKKKFIEDFSGISDTCSIDQLMGWSKSDATDFKLGREIKTGMDGVTALKERIVCPEAFSKVAINFDGTVSICCVDWTYGTIVGDLKKESFKDIWYGEKLRDFRILQLSARRREIKACSNCDYQKGLPENAYLDDDAERLLELYSKG